MSDLFNGSLDILSIALEISRELYLRSYSLSEANNIKLSHVIFTDMSNSRYYRLTFTTYVVPISMFYLKKSPVNIRVWIVDSIQDI